MRATAWTGSRAARGAALGFSLLAGLVALGGAGAALAQGMANPIGGSGYRSGSAAQGDRNAAKPGPRTMGYIYRPGPRVNGAYFRTAEPKTCGQFKYWSTAKARCMDARTSPAVK